MSDGLVFTVGNDMMGDDAAGPLLAQKLERSPLEGWTVLDAGSAPENYVHRVRELGPQRVVIVDAAEMSLPPGEVRRIDPDSIGALFLMTTHSLPLSYLMDALREFVPSVELIGIQPGIVAFGGPVSPEISGAVEQVYAWLQGGPGLTGSIQPI